MDQSDVLGRVAAARGKVAQTIAHLEGSRDQVQELLTATGEHFSTLQNEFTNTLAHLQSEAARAADAAQDLVETLVNATTQLGEAAQHHHQALATIAQSAMSGAHNNDTAAVAINEHGRTVSDRLTLTKSLFDDTRDATTRDRESHETGVATLETAITNWKSQLDAKSYEQRGAIDAHVLQLTGETTQHFTDTLTHAIKTARTALDERQHEIEERSSHKVEEIKADREHARDEMSHLIDQMRGALDDLGELVSTTSGTMIDGAEHAQDLMKMTNIGVHTVIGLIENLKQIFDEIESAWN